MNKLLYSTLLITAVSAQYGNPPTWNRPPTWAPPTWAKPPTKAPTKPWTKPPTDAPTWSPTDKPTIEPTKAPTDAPTATPTKAPTEAAADPPQGEKEILYEHNLVLNDGKVEIKMSGDDESVTVEMTYVGESYIAFAFSNDNQMPASTAIIALPDDGTVLKYDLTGRSAPSLSSQQTLVDASYTQQNGITSMKFTKLLVEPGEPSITDLANPANFLYAWGPGNTLEYHGSNRRGAFQLALKPEEELLQREFVSDDGNLAITMTANPADETLTVEMYLTGQSYLAFGFSNDDKMTNSVAIIALPEDGTGVPQKYTIGGSKSRDAIELAGSQTLIDASYTQTDTTTSMKFTKKLSEPGEPSISLESSNFFLYAYGDDNNNLSYHQSNRGVLPISFVEVDNGGEDVAPTAAPTIPQQQGGNLVNLGPGRIQRNLEFQDGDLEVTLVTDENDQTITVTATRFGNGYLAFGFSEDDKMTDTVAVIAIPSDGTGVPQKYNIGGSRSREAITLSNQQTLTDASYEQTDDSITMTFTKALAEPGEPTVSLEDSNFFLYAYADNDNLVIHDTRAAFALVIDSDEEVSAIGVPNKGLWAFHGICMFLSWVVLIPIGIASSIARKFVPGAEGTWFKIHRICNSAGVLLTIVGFFIAVYLIQDEQGDTAKHFKTKTHHKVGLFVFLFAVLQGLSGAFRPHAPHAVTTEVEEDADDEVADFSQKKKPAAVPAMEPKTQIRAVWEYQHRILGAVTVILGWWNSDTGIAEFSLRYDSSDFGVVVWVIAFIITVVAIGLRVYQSTTASQQ